MMINETGSNFNKSFLVNSIQDNAKSSIQGSNISGSGSLVSTGRISSQPINGINGQNIELQETCTQFEQIFIKYMVDKMWSSTEAGSGKQSTEKSVWQDYFNTEISKVIAESSMTGIAETLYGQLSATLQSEEVSDAASVSDLEATDAESEENIISDNKIII